MAVLDILKRSENAEPEQQPASSIPRLPIRQIIDGERRLYLLKLLSHLRGTQHDHKRYDWDARLIWGEENSILDVPVDSYVPLKRRRPCISLRLGKVIVKRLTTMVFGHDRFPTLVIEGDEDAQDYVRELARVAKLRTKMAEARDKGGACGTVVLSWGFVYGKPVVDVHSAAFVEVLEWEDYENRIPAKVLKVYDYRKKVFKADGKPEDETYWCVRYWDDRVDQTWPSIPDEAAKSDAWQAYPSTIVVHDLGACPLVWVQNIADSDDVDGICDADGQHEDFDEMDRLASATERGTVANVDPTLVVKDKKGKGETIVRKGSGTVIYSPGGANYLELAGSAVDAAKSLLQSIKQAELDEAEVVLLEPEKLSGAGVSAASLKVRYAPMLAKCDLLRDQYGEAIVTVLTAMLETTRRLESQPTATTDEGVEVWSKVELEQKVETSEELDEDGNSIRVKAMVERTPGTSSHLTLKWPAYFPATWQDRKDGVETATKATGGEPVLSQHSAIELVAPMLDIEDANVEVDRIKDQQCMKDERARELMGVGAPEPPQNLQPQVPAPAPGEEKPPPEPK